MIVVIQCAASKRADAGYLRTRKGRRIMFVAKPDLAPDSDEFHFAHPDDPSDTDGTWRDVLVRYNAEPGGNPLRLLTASALYTHPTYARLSREVAAEKLFILSAGWGLLPASFLTPRYDITFSAQAERMKRRHRADRYCDLVCSACDQDEPMVFFGGKDYVPLFAQLTAAYRGTRTIFFSSRQAPVAEGCRLERYETTTRTNWHYACADSWLDAC